MMYHIFYKSRSGWFRYTCYASLASAEVEATRVIGIRNIIATRIIASNPGNTPSDPKD